MNINLTKPHYLRVSGNWFPQRKCEVKGIAKQQKPTKAQIEFKSNWLTSWGQILKDPSTIFKTLFKVGQKANRLHLLVQNNRAATISLLRRFNLWDCGEENTGGERRGVLRQVRLLSFRAVSLWLTKSPGRGRPLLRHKGRHNLPNFQNSFFRNVGMHLSSTQIHFKSNLTHTTRQYRANLREEHETSLPFR